MLLNKVTLWGAAGSVLAITLMGLYIWGLHGRIDSLKADLKFVKGERNFAIEQYTQCLSDQRLTQEVSNAHEEKISHLNVQLRDAKRLLNNTPACVPVASAACQCDVPTPERKPSGQNGLRSEWLLDFAAEGEQYRLQLISCQDFIKKTWERAEKK